MSIRSRTRRSGRRSKKRAQAAPEEDVCIPPKQSAEFVSHMEDVLEVYRRPHDPRYPVVCLDETFTQLIGETRQPLPPAPGRVERYDCVYVRNGTASLFLVFEP